MELQKNLNHFKFWNYFYWKHDKATESGKYYAWQDNMAVDLTAR